MAQYHTNQRQRRNAAHQQAAQSALPLQTSLQVSRKLDCTKPPTKDAQLRPARDQGAASAPGANATRLQLGKITCLTPAGGVEDSPIAPSGGVESPAITPGCGAIGPISGTLSTPGDGDHLEKPSVSGFQPSTSEKFSASHHADNSTALKVKQPILFTSCTALCYIARKPRGPVTQKHQIRSGCTSTDKRGFVTPKFLGAVRLNASAQWLRGVVGATRKGVRTASDVFLTTTLHQLHSKMQMVVSSLIPEGTQTMTAATKASRRAAPSPTAMGTSDPIQLHADAHNALNMAVFYLRQPDANVAGARRKAIQALTALRGLSLALEG